MRVDGLKEDPHVERTPSRCKKTLTRPSAALSQRERAGNLPAGDSFLLPVGDSFLLPVGEG